MPKLPGTRPRSPHFADRAYTPHWVRRELGPLLPIAVPFHVRAPYRAHRRGSIAGDGIRRQPSVAPTNRCCSASKRGYDGYPGFERCAGGAAETAGIEPFSRSLSWSLPCSLSWPLPWPPRSGSRPRPIVRKQRRSRLGPQAVPRRRHILRPPSPSPSNLHRSQATAPSRTRPPQRPNPR
jgi:hypothetical protein